MRKDYPVGGYSTDVGYSTDIVGYSTDKADVALSHSQSRSPGSSPFAADLGRAVGPLSPTLLDEG